MLGIESTITPGVHSEINWAEMTRLDERLETLKNIFKEDKATEHLVDKVSALGDFVASVLQERVNSKHFNWVSPFRVDFEAKAFSQIRAVTIKPEHLVAVATSIVKKGHVFSPILTVQSTTVENGCESQGLNGAHRHGGAKKSIKDKQLSKDFQIPEIRIPRKLANELASVFPMVQAILNDHPPVLTNNKNDVQKIMLEYCHNNGWENIDESRKEELFRIAKILFAEGEVSEKQIKNNLTRLQRKLDEQSGHVFCGNPEDFVSMFIDYVGGQHPKKPKSYNKELLDMPGLADSARINFTSAKGSVCDQLFRRQLRGLRRGEYKTLIEVFASQDNGGDAETVIRERKNYFELMFEQWQWAQEDGGVFRDYVYPDYVVISPQILSNFTSEIDGQTVVVNPETTQMERYSNSGEFILEPTMKIIARADIINCFKKGKAYEARWIAEIDG